MRKDGHIWDTIEVKRKKRTADSSAQSRRADGKPIIEN